MDSITGLDMLLEMDKAGGLGILTRFIGNIHEQTQQIQMIREAKERGAKQVGCAIGIKNGVLEHARKLLNEGCDVICLDIAHGDHKKMYDAIKQVEKLKDEFCGFSLMAGNVCTPEATIKFFDSGVDIVKVGIGPGAACTTRRVTGSGMPQLTAILQCAQVAESRGFILADGGLRTTGDMIKALWAGADACMSGYMLAGTSATPDIDNNKMYRGMSSRTVHQRRDVAAEGVDMTVHYNGKTSVKMEDYKQGLRSGLAMEGAADLEALRQVKCTKVSVFTMKESEPVV